MFKFSYIINRNDLADYLKIPIKKLTYILYIKKVDSYYNSFEIPKKSGGVRQINAPTGELKAVQKKLAFALWEHQRRIWKDKNLSPNVSHAFEPKKSIMTNARIHRNKRFVYNIDLESFFDSFHFGRVKGFFEKNKELSLPTEVATVIAQLTCYNGHLPQGAPSSPIITNLICQILDYRLLKVAKKYKLDYTRYADDLTFSTNNKDFINRHKAFLSEISSQIERAGFHINEKKTRLQYKNSKQIVTGLVVNKKLSVDNEYYRETRAMAHTLYTEGRFHIDGIDATMIQLEGRYSFINQIDCYNNQQDGEKHHFRRLNGREKEYQKFLFFKYFVANMKPLIVTEGKTDIVYLKAALKSLYLQYPELVTKNENGQFEFKVSFLKRSKRLAYFLGISLDGADAMKSIYNYFNPPNGDQQAYPNYFSYFARMRKNIPRQPVFLLFDNEVENPKKPLSHFVSHTKLNEEKKTALKSNLSVKLVEDSNLFLLTNQLVNDKPECEIEDLFGQEALSHKIGGKTFSRLSQFDISKHYGKDIFANYVNSNIGVIDFSGFKRLLDAIVKTVESF